MKNIPLAVSRIKQIDRITINRYGIPSIVLMERAGISVAREALAAAGRLNYKKQKITIAVFSGKGNNGGDGLVCARYLASAGFGVQVYMLGTKQALKGDCFYNMLALQNPRIGICQISNTRDFNLLKKRLHAHIVIDAIFGTGFHGSPENIYGYTINLINRIPAYKISVDVPSGLDADTGRTEGTVVFADLTVTMGFAKRGFFRQQGPACCKEIRIADIGLRQR
jgi:ADP-dependent NAD(P)H-hydrate dehydratase / NAD(P)H-hydrate epimerase